MYCITFLICATIVILGIITGFILLVWQRQKIKAAETKSETENTQKKELEDRYWANAEKKENANKVFIEKLIGITRDRTDMPEALKIVIEKIKNIYL